MDVFETPSVRVVAGLGTGGSTAVFLHGDHDYASLRAVQEALDPLQGDVIVDLSWCWFVDSSIIAAILEKHAALRREGSRLEVLLPPHQAHLSRTFARLGMPQLLPVRNAPRA